MLETVRTFLVRGLQVGTPPNLRSVGMEGNKFSSALDSDLCAKEWARAGRDNLQAYLERRVRTLGIKIPQRRG